jgi:hypothetical protein
MTYCLFVCGYRISEELASVFRTQIRSELRRKWTRTAAMRNTQRTVRAKGNPLVFLTSAVNGDEWEATRHDWIVLEERSFCLCQTGSWVGPFVGLHAVSKRNIAVSARTRTQIPLSPSSQTSHYNDWCIPALYLRVFHYTLIKRVKQFLAAYPNELIYFNPLKTKCRPLYLKTQTVPRCKHFPSRL